MHTLILPNAKLLVDNKIAVYIIYDNKVYGSNEEFSRYLKEVYKLNTAVEISTTICKLPCMKYDKYINLLAAIYPMYTKEHLTDYLNQQLALQEYITLKGVVDHTDILSPG